MNKNPLNKGVLTENAIGIGTVTQGMVEARARELATIAGRASPEPCEADLNRPNGNERANRRWVFKKPPWNRYPNKGLRSRARFSWTSYAGVVWRRRGCAARRRRGQRSG